MIVLSDNDVILKLAQCNLLSQLPVVLINPPNRSSLTLLLVFSFCQKNPDKAIRKCGSQVVYEQVGAFIESVQDIPEVQDSQLIELLGSVPELM